VDPTQTHSPGDGAPPPGPPWDSPIAETPLAFIDLEMTGLRVGEDRVIEICIERVRGDVCVERLQQVINPAGRSGAGTEHVHGLLRDELEAAPTFDTVADATCRLLEGAVLVAHGAQWDLAFLADELGRLGRADRAPTHAIDTLVLCRRALHLAGYGLQNVATALSIPVARAHRAGDDVATLRAVWTRVVPELSPRTARDLWEVRVGERQPRPAIVASLQEALRVGEPVEIVYRPARRAAERLLVVLSSLVPPHAIGYLLPGRGRRELRIDRILRVEPHSP
jgi:DNA polymerase-3 subunit epsilon